jgi:hypothetical protein
MVKRLFHEPGERLRAAIPNLAVNGLDQGGITIHDLLCC